MRDESDHFEEPSKVWLSVCCDAEPLEDTDVCSRCLCETGFSEAWFDAYGNRLRMAG